MYQNQVQDKQENVLDQIKPILEIVKIQPNHFLFKEIQEFVNSISINPKFPDIPMHFPQKVVLILKSLFNDLGQQSDERIQQTITQLKANIQLQSPPENHFGEASNILLAANSIKQLPVNHTLRLLNILSKPTSDKIDGFLNEINIDRDILQAEIKGKKFKNKSIPNLSTLISQLTKEERLDPSLFTRIIQNQSNMNIFKDKLLHISNQDYSFNVRGKIIQSSYQNNQAIFILQDNKNNHNINLNLSDGQINQATISSEFLLLLRSELQKYQYCKENDTIIKGAKISVNPKFLNKKISVLPNGTYDIMMGSRFSWQKGHYLKFVNKATQQLVEFEIYDGGIIDNKIILENARVKHKKWETTSDYSDFVQYYEILSKQKHVIEFKSVEESNQLISIKQFTEIEAFDIIEKMYEINKLKSQIIGKLLSNSKDVFDELLNELIKLGDLKNSKILNKILESNQGVNITDTIQILIETYKEIGQPKNQDEILNDVITETNYSMFVSKEESVDTVRILRLLSDAQRHTENLKGKDIIAFFGNTGSGKSTSVNYFMGIPLEKYQNIFGEQVIRIDMKEYENKGLKQTANIGQSIGTSETIYSQGHSIIIEDFNKDVQDTMLCDNPGFLDTRGTDYEICTNLSIDQAIDKCKSIKSIVLVVPFSIFTLDRANHIFSLIYLMKERFPQIMEINSPTNKSFHILITKLANQMQKDGFRDRLNAHITEEQKIISELYQDDRQNIQIGIKKERLNLFIVLLMMLNEDRLKFIDIADQFERDEILQNYLNSNPITKDNYKNAMEGEEMRESFGRQISLSAHTWTSLILKPFLLENPSKSENIKKMIEECNQEIKSYHIDIDDSKKCIESSKDDIIALENQIIIMEGNLTDDEISKILQSSGLQINENKSHQIDFIEAKIDIKLQRKKEYEKTIQDTQIQIENLNVKILESDKKIKQWKTGEDKITIIKRSFQIGQVINYQYLDQKKADKAMQNVEDYENGEIKGSYTVGKDQMNLITIQVIHSKYSLVPNKDFDKNDYISKGLISGSQGIFKANIKSRRCQLIAVNEKDGGKSIILQYVMNYVPCSKEEDLPYLEISHTIPNSIIFNDSIVNEKSDKEKNEADLKSNQEILNEYEDKIKKLNQEIHEYENEVKEIIEQNKKLQVLKSQQEIIDKYKADLANLKNHIIKLEQNVEIDKKKIIETEKLIQNHDQNQNTLNEKQRRLAFLINDQLRKKIPQSLYKFIDISFKLNDSFQEKSKENGFTKSAKNQNERFLQFKNMYSWHEKDLLASIDSYLYQN